MSEEPNYSEIRTAFEEGRAVPFLGAGASVSSGFPTSLELCVELLQTAPLCAAASCRFCHHLLNEWGDVDLPRTASWWSRTGDGRRRLRELLEARLQGPPSDTRLHAYLAKKAKVIITTNYDCLVEQAFSSENDFDLVVCSAGSDGITPFTMHVFTQGRRQPVPKPNELARFVRIGERPLVYKMHGSIRFGGGDRACGGRFVISEEDYEQAISRFTDFFPAAMLEYLEGKNLLFLGYSLRDWNVRLALKKLISHEQEYSWAFVKDCSEIEQQVWAERKLRLYRRTTDDFLRGVLA